MFINAVDIYSCWGQLGWGKVWFLFTLWGFFVVTYNWVHPVGWVVPDSDDHIWDSAQQVNDWNWVVKSVEWGASLMGSNLTCWGKLCTLPKQWAWLADHSVTFLVGKSYEPHLNLLILCPDLGVVRNQAWMGFLGIHDIATCPLRRPLR